MYSFCKSTGYLKYYTFNSGLLNAQLKVHTVVVFCRRQRKIVGSILLLSMSTLNLPDLLIYAHTLRGPTICISAWYRRFLHPGLLFLTQWSASDRIKDVGPL